MLWLAFSVVRHADSLAIILGEPYGTLILTLSVISIEVIMISAVMIMRFQHLRSVTLQVTLFCVIQSFKHKGLERFFKTGKKSGVQAKHANRLRLILGRLNASTSPADMDLPGLYLHQLTGDRKEIWSVRVSGNWRVTFRFNGVHAEVVDYEDYR